MNKPTGAGKSGPRRHAEKVDREALAAVSGVVTAMDPQRRDPKRRSLFVDGSFVVGLYEETIILAGFKVGRQVEGAALLAALGQDEIRQAYNDGMAMLAMMAYTRREVERKLARRFPADVVQMTADRLAQNGWLDDAAFARSYVRSHPDYGSVRLLRDLARKGVDREAAGAAVREILHDVDAVGQAREAAAVRLGRMGAVDRDTAQRRLSGFLVRRGYDFETISRALGPLLQELPRAERVRSAGAGWPRRSRWGANPDGPDETEMN